MFHLKISSTANALFNTVFSAKYDSTYYWKSNGINIVHHFMAQGTTQFVMGFDETPGAFKIQSGSVFTDYPAIEVTLNDDVRLWNNLVILQSNANNTHVVQSFNGIFQSVESVKVQHGWWTDGGSQGYIVVMECVTFTQYNSSFYISYDGRVFFNHLNNSVNAADHPLVWTGPPGANEVGEVLYYTGVFRGYAQLEVDLTDLVAYKIVTIAALLDHSTRITTLEGQMITANASIGLNAGNITINAGAISTLEGRVTALETFHP